MAADWQKWATAKIAALPADQRTRVMAKHGLKAPAPDINVPRERLESNNGIGVYFNPHEGMEVMQDFNDLLSGLKKKGRGLTECEEVSIWGWLKSESVSPGFVRRLLEAHGTESIAAAFMLDGRQETYVLEYLLRRFKGRFYRPRYPSVRMVQ